jgi:uncharacterized repeat protein (TIGR01451 family)
VLTDTLPGGVTFVSASPGCYQAAGDTVTCTVDALAYQATTAVAIAVTAPATAGTITNTATVAGVAPDLDPGNNTVTETTTVSEWADLAVAKVAAPNPVLVGSPLTYTLTITNYGLYDAHNVLLTDTLPADVVMHTDAALLLHLDEPPGATTFSDASGSGNHGACTGDTCPTAGESGVSGAALRFDGVDDYVQVPDSIHLRPDPFTVAAWFQWDGVGTDNVNFMAAKGYENYEIHTGGDAGINGIRFIPAGYPASHVDAPNAIHTGWNHVAAVYTGDRALVYVDSNLVVSRTAITGANDLSADTSPFHIGRRSDGSYPFRNEN